MGTQPNPSREKFELSRREFLAGASAILVQATTGLASIAAGASPTQLEEFDYGQVQLTGGALKEQYDRIHGHYLALDNNSLLKVYRERAGMPAPGAQMGGWYDADGFVPGHGLGQYISGLVRIGRTTGDAACQSKVGELVEGFAATMGDGNRIFAGPNAEKVWPCYILDKHLIGLMDAYSLSGIEQARELLSRVLHGALPYIPEQGHDRVGKKDPPYDETYVLPENLFAAHKLTGDDAFHHLAQEYLLDRDYFDPLARGQDVLPGRHAYSHAIALSSAGKAHLVLGEEKYLKSMKNAWGFLATSQQYASGGWGPNETFIEPHKGMLYESLHTTEDHFETPCGSYAAMKLARYLLCACADGRYGDGLERVVYNTILAAKQPDKEGDYPYYSTYGAQARKVYYPRKWPCCSGTLVQGVADYVKNIYFRSADGVAVVLFAPSTLRWKQAGVNITLTQETEYPLGEKVTLRLACQMPTSFSLSLRIPQWLDRPATIAVNGKFQPVEVLKGFAVIRRLWSQGDTVTLDLPQAFRTEAIDDLHPDTVAVLRGPLLYVQLNPPQQQARLGRLESLKSIDGSPGSFVERQAGLESVHAPIYSVREERYTTYFDKG
ncbi:MAG: beta-L-arabinofuranosidase domain-containing protein [Terracidiphilus sp.]|jgi:hypothetical protein